MDIIGVGLPDPPTNLNVDSNVDLLTDMALFTGGVFNSIDGAAINGGVGALDPALVTLRAQISGAFALLYDMDIPASAGKVGRINFTVSVTIDNETQSATYEGPLEIRGSNN